MMSKAAVERRCSANAAKNHRGHGKAPFVPSLKTAGKGPNPLKSPPAQLQGDTRARQLMRSTTVKDDFAIPRDRGSLLGIIVSKTTLVHAYCTGNALMEPQTVPVAV